MSNAELYEDMLGYDDTDYSNPRVTKFNKPIGKETVMEKEDTHIIIKREDVLKYLTEPEQIALDTILNAIIRGRKADQKKSVNNYYIVNKDEPYAEVVHGIIIGGEAVKEQILSDKKE